KSLQKSKEDELLSMQEEIDGHKIKQSTQTALLSKTKKALQSRSAELTQLQSENDRLKTQLRLLQTQQIQKNQKIAELSESSDSDSDSDSDSGSNSNSNSDSDSGSSSNSDSDSDSDS